MDANEVDQLVSLLKCPPHAEGQLLLDLFVDRVPAGVDEAAYIKDIVLGSNHKRQNIIAHDYSRASNKIIGYDVATMSKH